MPDTGEIERKLRETEPDKVREMKTEEIIEHERYFADKLPRIAGSPLFRHWHAPWQSRLDFLGSVIADRDLTAQSKSQHQELFGTAKKTLCWAIVGGVTGIALVLIAAWPLIRDTFFSKVQLASAPSTTLAMPLQTQSPTSVSPVPAASSNSATPSPRQAATAQPSLSPPKSSPSP